MEAGPVRLAALGWYDEVERVPDGVLGVMAEQVLGAGTPRRDHAVGVGHDDALPGGAVIPMPPSSTRGGRRSSTNGTPIVHPPIVPVMFLPTPSGASPSSPAPTTASARRRRALATAGADVLVTYLRTEAVADLGPPSYGRQRAADAARLAAIDRCPAGCRRRGRPHDDDVAGRLFDEAESQLGPVSILVNNASGWLADTFTPDAVDRLGRGLTGVSPATIDRNLGVDARAGALLVAELARRHVARGARWGRIVGLTSGGPMGFPQEVSYGAAKAALENYTMAASPSWPRTASRPTSCTRR